MFTSRPKLSPHTEKLLEAANSASQTVATLHVAFMAFAAYLGVIIWGTTHEDLLRISPMKLPILDVELSLTTFYSGVPWLLVLLHFNLLMQLELLSRKLWNLDRDLNNLANPVISQPIRDQLFIFPFTHLIAGRSNIRLVRWLLSLVVGLTVIALPLFMLLAAQIRFLPFHDEGITWSQRLAIWVDILILLALWPLIASANDRNSEWWRNVVYRLLGYWFALYIYYVKGLWNRLVRWLQHSWARFYRLPIASRLIPTAKMEAKGMYMLLLSLIIVFPFSIIALVPGNIKIDNYYQSLDSKSIKDKHQYLEDWLIQHVPKSWLSMLVKDIESDKFICATLDPDEGSARIMLSFTCDWFEQGVLSRNLNIREIQLLPKNISASLITRAIDPDKSIRSIAFKEFYGFNLQERDLRFADLSLAILPKIDLRKSLLQGAKLDEAHMEGANLIDTNMENANLDQTYLEDAIFTSTKYPFTNNVQQLKGANLHAAQLKGTDLSGVNLQGMNLHVTDLQGADLSNAQLQGSNLHGTNLQGANLSNAQLQGSNLHVTNLQGANLSSAQLQGSNLHGTDLQGANLIDAKLQGTYIHGSDFRGANLSGIEFQGNLGNITGDLLDNVFIRNTFESDWNEIQQLELETLLKPLLNKDDFRRVKRVNNMRNSLLSLGNQKPISSTNCYSENPKLLQCIFSTNAQLKGYRAKLHLTLVELSCSDIAIAEGIAKRSLSQGADQNGPDFGLAATLLHELNKPKVCTGLAGLSKETRQQLQDEVTLEQTEKNMTDDMDI